MRANQIAKIREKIKNHVRSRYARIVVTPHVGRFNFRCFENVVEECRLNPDFEVIEVIYIDDGYPILHYINRNKLTNEHLETTLGWKAEHLEYYGIRVINPIDYKWIESEFTRGLDCWLYEFSNWFQRKILRINRVL